MTALHGVSANASDSRNAARIAFLPSSPGCPLHDGNGSMASASRAGDTRTSTGGDVHYLHVLRRLLPGGASVSREAMLD